MICKHCSQEVVDDSKFCNHCGKDVEIHQTSNIELSTYIVKITDNENLLEFANAELLLENYEKAERLFDDILKVDSKNSYAWIGKAYCSKYFNDMQKYTDIAIEHNSSEIIKDKVFELYISCCTFPLNNKAYRWGCEGEQFIKKIFGNDKDINTLNRFLAIYKKNIYQDNKNIDKWRILFTFVHLFDYFPKIKILYEEFLKIEDRFNICENTFIEGYGSGKKILIIATKRINYLSNDNYNGNNFDKSMSQLIKESQNIGCLKWFIIIGVSLATIFLFFDLTTNYNYSTDNDYNSPSLLSDNNYNSPSLSSDSSGSSDSNAMTKEIFTQWISTSLSPMCTKAYFNSSGELIIEVNSTWHDVSDGEKKDIIYFIESKLKEKKNSFGVEGYGQFFSEAGRGLETFYAD